MSNIKRIASTARLSLHSQRAAVMLAVPCSSSQSSVLCFSTNTKLSQQYEHGIHRSNAEGLINKVPVIEVEGHVALCDGGGGALGHPIEYIQLDTSNGKPGVCKYCGLRFSMKHGGHH